MERQDLQQNTQHQPTDIVVTNDQLPSPPSAVDTEPAYANVVHDPRFLRLLAYYSPKFKNTRGVMQKLKDHLEASHIPILGALVLARRANNNRKHTQELRDLKSSDPSHQEVLNQMIINMRVQTTRESVSATLKGAFFVFPIVLVPGGSAVVNKIAKTVATTAVIKGSTIAGKAMGEQPSHPGRERAVHEIPSSEEVCTSGYSICRAFIRYLGLAETSNPIYSHWERSRIFLKEMYGASAADDIPHMPPKGELKRQLDAMHSRGEFNLDELKCGLLYVLWYIYNVWQEKNLIDSLLRENMEREIREDTRYTDSFFHPNNRNIIKLDEMHVREVVKLMMAENSSWSIHGARYQNIFGNTPPDDSNLEALAFWVGNLARRYIRAGCGWGYVAQNSTESLNFHHHPLLAVVFWNPPDNKKAHRVRSQKVPMSQRPRATQKIGFTRLNDLTKVMADEEKLRSNMAAHSGFFHFYGVSPRGMGALRSLICTLADERLEPVYAMEYRTSPLWTCLGNYFNQVDIEQGKAGELVLMQRNRSTPFSTERSFQPNVTQTQAYPSGGTPIPQRNTAGIMQQPRQPMTVS